MRESKESKNANSEKPKELEDSCGSVVSAIIATLKRRSKKKKKAKR